MNKLKDRQLEVSPGTTTGSVLTATDADYTCTVSSGVAATGPGRIDIEADPDSRIAPLPANEMSANTGEESNRNSIKSRFTGSSLARFGRQIFSRMRSRYCR